MGKCRVEACGEEERDVKRRERKGKGRVKKRGGGQRYVKRS